MTEASWDSNLIEVCKIFGIGMPQGTPLSITGGLLHRLWRIETEIGLFAVKILNPEVMSRPEAIRNFRLSERLAQEAYRNDIYAVPAKTVANEPLIELNGTYIMLFDWIDGQTLPLEKCTSKHGKRMGEVLFQIHNLDVEIEDLEFPISSVVPIDTWKGHIEKACQDKKCWGFSCETLLQDVFNWSRLYQESIDNLSQQLVISHRDLDAKNVVWNNEDTPFLIDWESTGYVNPMVELIEVALNWSRNQDGTSDKERFQTVIEAYLEAGGSVNGKASDALHASFGGMLGWLEYNMRRSMDEDIFDIDDRELGHREVIHTVNDLKKLNEAVPVYSQWVEEIS